MTRRWIRIAGDWHLPGPAPRDPATCCGLEFPTHVSTCEIEGVPTGDVCPTCYRSTKTQAELDEIADIIAEAFACTDDFNNTVREVALLIGAR